MDIFILSNGKEIGPFSAETAQTLIGEGTVAGSDLAWASGMEDWAPLDDVLALAGKADVSDVSDRSDSSDPSGQAPVPAPAAHEPATAKQKAFLGYLAIDVPENLTKEQASTLVNGANEDPALVEQIGTWSADRLQLHPDLFVAEIHERKEDRASHFFEVCQTEGAQYFTRITKAHCQVLVGFLDAKFPTWDSHMVDAATNYFFPAIAEKFPQLVERQWKNRFHYVEAPGHGLAASAARFKKRPITALEAILRGLALGAAVLAVLYFGQRMVPRRTDPVSEKATSGNASAPSYPPGSPAPKEK